MKKVISLLIPLACASLAMADGLKGNGKYGSAGCGLGSLALGDQPGPIQIVVATVNNILVPQTSAISTGTSNCFEDGVALNDKQKEFFANSNFESLHQEMAQGKGENLTAFAALYGCNGEGIARFSSSVQSHYGEIFSGKESDASAMLNRVDTIVSQDTELKNSCSDV